MQGDPLIVIQAQSAQSDEQRRAFFDELVRRYHAMVFGYSHILLGDAQLAEDATQEAFITAYQLLGQLREPHAFAGWLRRIVHTHCHRLLKQGKATTQSLDQVADLLHEEATTQSLLEHQEMQHAVRALISDLPDKQQTPLVLYYLEDYSLQEIADSLGLSLAAVKKRLERARNQLQERMHGMAQEYLGSIGSGRGMTREIFTALMKAATVEGEYTLLEMLLVEGIDLNEQDMDGQTMLHWAAREGHLGAVELLLEYHPDLTRRDHAGRTAQQLAISGGHHRIAERLRPSAGSQQ